MSGTGTAKTDEFLLSTATVMVGPQSKVFELTPDLHSIGLVKNVQASADVGFTELTQGINAQVVMSVNTKLDTKISFEVYEYTARNLAYGVGLDGSDTKYDPIDSSDLALATAITAGGSSIVLEDAAVFAVGDYIVLQDINQLDRLHVGKVASKASETITLATGYTMPTTMVFTIATTKVYKINPIGVGLSSSANTFGCKIVGILPSSNKPVTLIFPKIKVTKGLSVSFAEGNFSNMPFEFTPYQLVTDDPYYADFAGDTWKILT